MKFTGRQNEILRYIKTHGKVTIDDIAEKFNTSFEDIKIDIDVLMIMDAIDVGNDSKYFYFGAHKEGGLSTLIQSFKVRDVMSLPIVVDESTSIYDTIVMMFLENVGTIFVVDDSMLKGVVTRKDLLRSTLGKLDLNMTPVSVAMTRKPNIHFAFRDDTIYDCAKRITEFQIDSLPIVEDVNKDGKSLRVVGRITKTNIARIFVDIGTNENILE
ncbi:MAG: CBS domain-containing protein [Tissierellia bacterium]|nr:CBS domain-containing protein [Tissierellia bacterium]